MVRSSKVRISRRSSQAVSGTLSRKPVIRPAPRTAGQLGAIAGAQRHPSLGDVGGLRLRPEIFAGSIQELDPVAEILASVEGLDPPFRFQLVMGHLEPDAGALGARQGDPAALAVGDRHVAVVTHRSTPACRPPEEPETVAMPAKKSWSGRSICGDSLPSR